MPYVRPDVQAMLAMLAAAPGPQMHESDAATARQMMRMMGQLTERPRGELRHVRDFTIPGDHGHVIPARVYSDAANPGPGPVMVFFHGGGWVIGDLETHDSLCAETARTLGITVVSIDYRLAPEHVFPAATEDCLAATRWLANTPMAVGHVITGLIPAGDSAGGNLAAAVTQELHGKLPVPILAQWLIYPAVAADGGASMDEFAEGYLLSRDGMIWFSKHYQPDLSHRWAAPITNVSADLPPAMVFVCGLDPLRDQGRAYAAALVSHGVRTIYREAAGQIHGCFNIRQGIPSAQDDLHGCLKDLRVLVDEAVAALPAMAQAAE